MTPCGNCKQWRSLMLPPGDGRARIGVCNAGVVPGYARARRETDEPHRATCFERRVDSNEETTT